MKKLLLIILFPSVSVASEQSTEKKPELTTGQKAAYVPVIAASWGYSGYAGAQHGLAIAKALFAGDYIGAGIEVVKTIGTTISVTTATRTACDIIEPPQTKTPFEIAAERSAARAKMEEETASADLRRCLNEHAHCNDLNGMGIP